MLEGRGLAGTRRDSRHDRGKDGELLEQHQGGITLIDLMESSARMLLQLLLWDSNGFARRFRLFGFLLLDFNA